jgi:NADH-quinone oxidoreductase subunit J
VAELLFYVLSAVCLAGAAGVVLAKSPMLGVLSLLASFSCLAVIYLLAGFQFMAAAQIVVYAGAILVLFLFVIMLLHLGALGPRVELIQGRLSTPRGRTAAVVAVALALFGLIAAQRGALEPSEAAPIPGGPRDIGGIDRVGDLAVALFGRYGLAFEAASLMLLATMVAVIVLAKRKRAPRSSDSHRSRSDAA